MTDPTPRSPNVAVSLGHRALRVDINGLPHIYLDRAKVAGFTTWIEGHPGRTFVIEFVLAGGQYAPVEYDDRRLWENVIKQVAEVLG